MRFLGDDEATQLRGIDLYQGTDGNLYEWVDGVDEWGRARAVRTRRPGTERSGGPVPGAGWDPVSNARPGRRRGSRWGATGPQSTGSTKTSG